MSASDEYSCKIDNILIQELKYNMLRTSRPPFRSPDLNMTLKKNFRSDNILGSNYKKIIEMDMLKEVMQLLSKRRFEEVRRMEVKQKTSRKSWNALYSIVLKNKEEIFGFAAIIFVPEIYRDIEKSRGVIYAVRHYIADKKDTSYEKATFENYIQEVRPQIEILGNLYRRTRRL